MKVLKFTLAGIALLLVLAAFAVRYQVRDRQPGYELDTEVTGSPEGRIRAGFAARSVTPDIIDTWNDVDGNARYEPKKGDSYNDNNGNGKFDAYWIAGFHNNRPANGVHDPVWARTMVIDDGTTRIALVALDAIGFFHDQVVDARNRIGKDLNVDYCMIASTHVHEAPDLLGIWGPSPLKSGVNKDYYELVISQIAESVKEAVADLEPVTLYFSENRDDALLQVTDTRKPVVHDPGIHLIHATREDGSTKGVLVSWANHPETLWSKNLLITSDFPHFFRKGIEEGTGGTCVYFNGAIGGLITTHPSVTIIHPVTGKELKDPTFEKAEAQGMVLSSLALESLRNPVDSVATAAMNLKVQTFRIPFRNPLFRLAASIGLMNRGMTGWWKIRTEMAAFTIGPASFLTIPGEIYPEIVNGGIEAPEGQDFAIEPQEVPPLRDLMPGNFKFVIGLANDELGYIIPKSQWDNKEPWLYHSEKKTYGEVNSLGPETAPILHSRAAEILARLRSK